MIRRYGPPIQIEVRNGTVARLADWGDVMDLRLYYPGLDPLACSWRRTMSLLKRAWNRDDKEAKVAERSERALRDMEFLVFTGQLK